MKNKKKLIHLIDSILESYYYIVCKSAYYRLDNTSRIKFTNELKLVTCEKCLRINKGRE